MVVYYQICCFNLEFPMQTESLALTLYLQNATVTYSAYEVKKQA